MVVPILRHFAHQTDAIKAVYPNWHNLLFGETR